MNQPIASTKLDRSPHWQLGLSVLVVTGFLSLRLLLRDNLVGGGWNEIDVLPLARHFIDPTWVADDWYLNQPPGYRLPFQIIFGTLAAHWGFLATSIVGRLICYGLVAFGLVLLSRRLGLSLPLLLLALALLLNSGCWQDTDCPQGAIAHEWLVGGLEAKTIAYGLVLLGLNLLLAQSYLWMALLMGLATSLHVLVGGWAFLVAIGWLGLRRSLTWQQGGWVLLIYALGSTLALPAVLAQLTAPPPSLPIQPSFIYVFVRLPHHLNPLSWSVELWLRPLGLLLLLALSLTVLQRQSAKPPAAADQARMGLAQYTLLALLPFGLGLLIAPFDPQGQLLQFYPFRLGDILLPLSTWLLAMCALERLMQQKLWRYVCIGLLVLLCGSWLLALPKQIGKVSQFPLKQESIDRDWLDFCDWIRQHTPKTALIVSPPVEQVTFTWLSERATIAKFKLFPQTKAGIAEWYRRMSDLSGSPTLWAGLKRQQDNRSILQQRLTAGYDRLTTQQALSLMQQYRADYFATRAAHPLALPIAYRNSRYILYLRSPQTPQT